MNLERYVKEINKALDIYLTIKEPEGLYKAARHLIRAGGKRIRPVLFLIVCEALGKDYRKVLPAAVSIEAIHNFTLIHDDIMDRDELRRGVPTVHKVFGEATAILAGDTLFAEAFKFLTECEVDARNTLKAVEKLSEVCIKICEGQYFDMCFEEKSLVSEEEYIEMVKLKTGVLLAASASLPAILFGERKEVVDALWNFGIYCGIGFQIHDDTIDITSEETGKDRGSDILKGKKTLIVIRAFNQGVRLSTFGRQKASSEELMEDLRKLEECGAIEYAARKAKEFIEKGKESIKILPDTEAKDTLMKLADFFISRRR
ncbi:MAG: polyprenyl synthetase family protein [Archaeoglobales archaeon]|nr:polyprenyl synthetase family protein [Archaeoglobales archaeon]